MLSRYSRTSASRVGARRARQWPAIAPAGLLALLAACGGGSESLAPPPPPPSPASVASVLVSPATADLVIGGTQQLSATPRDAGGATLSGRTVTWNSSTPGVASVSASGLVTGISAGSASVTATSEGRSGSATITVLPPPVATVVVTPPTSTVQVNATQQLTAATLDASNTPLTGRTVTWSSSSAAIASVSATGLVTGTGVGTATITATSEGKSASATVTVTPAAGAPAISGVTPATLIPGAPATITGTGFSGTPAQNTVTLQGVPMAVTAASTTSLTVTVPCVNSGPQAVSVTSAGLQGLVVNHPVGTTQRALAVGEAAILPDAAEAACNEIPVGGPTERYLVTVYSTATSQNTLADFALHGNPASGGGVAAMIAAAPARPPRRPATLEERRRAEQDHAHFLHLEENRRIYERAGGAAAGGMPPAGAAMFAAVPSLGDTRTFQFRAFGAGGPVCTPTGELTAKMVHVGSRLVIWEDELNSLQSAAQPVYLAALQKLAMVFDQEQYDIVKDNFGDPLRRDLDGDGRVHMILTQRVNGSGAVAFVSSCDQYPPASQPASNFGEFFYSTVPTTATLNLNSTEAVDGWLAFMKRTVIHEVKHVASHAARFANGSPVFEASWLEEATARHAEEIWLRNHLYQIPWKGNTGWGAASDNGLYCDFHLADATCNALDSQRRPTWGMRRHFHEFRNKLLEPWNWSPFGDGTGQTGSVFYQTGWSLVRYAADRFSASDGAFLTALNQATTQGATNLAARAGVSLDALLGGWGLAIFADDYPGLANPSPALQFPTWNLRDIYAGINASPAWTSQFPSPFLLSPVQLSGGAFSTERSGVRGGAHAYFEMTGVPGGGQLLRLTALTGGAPSPNLRVALARLQ